MEKKFTKILGKFRLIYINKNFTHFSFYIQSKEL